MADHLHDNGHCALGACGEAIRVAQPTLVDVSRLKRRDVLMGLATGTLVLAGCETNPYTGRSQLVGLAPGDSEMASLALDAWNKQKSETPISRDRVANEKLQRVGRRIAAVSGLVNQQWEFVVFDTPEKNAFVLPGGKVGFYKGLMEITENDDHIATVLGHEVGHVQGRHAAERYSQGMLAQAGGAIAQQTALGSSQLGMAALGLGLQVGVLLPFSRAEESEADRIGVDNMYKAGYDVRQALRFWEIMERQGGSRPPALMSTHPSPAGRMADLRAYINARGYAKV